MLYVPLDGDEVDDDSENNACLHTIRCVSIVPKSEDLHHTDVFFICIKTGGKSFSIMIDRGSCTNLVEKSVVDHIGLKVAPHPQLHSIIWVDKVHMLLPNVVYFSPSIFHTYHEQI